VSRTREADLKKIILTKRLECRRGCKGRSASKTLKKSAGEEERLGFLLLMIAPMMPVGGKKTASIKETGKKTLAITLATLGIPSSRDLSKELSKAKTSSAKATLI